MKGLFVRKKNYLSTFCNFTSHMAFEGRHQLKEFSPPTVKYWLYSNTATQGQTEVKNSAFRITSCNTA